MKARFLLVFLGLMAGGAAQAADPQAVLDGLIRQEQQRAGAEHRNEMLRLEVERRDLARTQRYQGASDVAIASELGRFCPGMNPPCRSAPPQALLQEAARRGLIELKAPARQGIECATFGDGLGGGITDCF